MKPPARAEANRWLAQAEADRDDAVLLQVHERHHLACFLAQQAAEKALNAVLVAHGVERVSGHSAGDLCLEAGKLLPAFASLQAEAALLDKFYVPTRYPDALPGGIPSRAYGKVDSDEALAIAGRIVAAAKEALDQAP
jgi:HEPN domain-containing protein